MKFGILLRKNATQSFGGDLVAIESVKRGLEEHGHTVSFGTSPRQLSDADFLFVTNSFYDHEKTINELGDRPYGVIGFHENHDFFLSPMLGMATYLQLAIHDDPSCAVANISIENGIDNEKAYQLFPFFLDRPKSIYPLLKKSAVCFANSNTEKETMLKQCPEANVKVVHWAPGVAENSPIYDESFLSYAKLKPHSYIVQIGRLSPRKNQLATILACRDMDTPLVLIATPSNELWYEESCIEAIRKYRKGRTIVVSQTLKPRHENHLEVIAMPDGKPLTREMIKSALGNCCLHFHVPFCELPGYTYLEALMVGAPSVGSEWTTIRDYFSDENGRCCLDDEIVFAKPTDIKTMTQLIKKQFGKKIKSLHNHPILKRKSSDVAAEMLRELCFEKN